ncbi:hypothetical protein LY78DRAFT_420748 [Colletotrichum sublineola]|nr:hypothetical protein LY78DRAFT_420748 [Colletotrichum sublineola]
MYRVSCEALIFFSFFLFSPPPSPDVVPPADLRDPRPSCIESLRGRNRSPCVRSTLKAALHCTLIRIGNRDIKKYKRPISAKREKKKNIRPKSQTQIQRPDYLGRPSRQKLQPSLRSLTQHQNPIHSTRSTQNPHHPRSLPPGIPHLFFDALIRLPSQAPFLTYSRKATTRKREKRHIHHLD